jgi:hypothetical protein
MGRRPPNPRRIKIHHSYTVDEVARILGVHKGTVRNWLKQGLEVIDHRKPILIFGPTLRHFLEARRARAKQTCPPGYLYCVRCRAPKPPALEMADYIPFTELTGNLRGICPDCGHLVHRRVALAKIDAVRGNLDITFSEALQRLSESTAPTVNCDLNGRGRTDEDTQP